MIQLQPAEIPGDRPPRKPHSLRLIGAVSFFLAAMVWTIYGQTLRFAFMDVDDNIYVFQNAAVIRGLKADSIERAFSFPAWDNWIPLTTLSHMMDCQFYGLNAGGHHLTNVLLHAATAILLFLLLLRMTNALWRSALVAALFAVHPLGVESVAWVTERKDVLSGLFFMLTLLCYTQYARLRPASCGGQAAAVSRFNPFTHLPFTLSYWLCLLFFACGLMSKAMLVTLPFVLLLLDYWPLNRLALRRPDGAVGGSALPGLLVEKIPLVTK